MIINNNINHTGHTCTRMYKKNPNYYSNDICCTSMKNEAKYYLIEIQLTDNSVLIYRCQF